ncbi:DUF563 domain-containing protein [Mucilaginibacter sp. UR6-11]|uniref:glycosyltransferase family 61 protein n=1 Tax=Mucilaginibacter sp. UR6-11 TaxID=1435644 RepID=UPI001E3C0E77|nr:glycosyltransferase family 61 protein [Mucilaginibacter sp. UR6-11]MCC8425732.1 glycosyltransferase family 61 protein [Mucilaginibacter sp. UR6-11]
MSAATKIKYFLRQFPFIYPSKIIYSCRDWIIGQRERKGLYYSQRGPWFEDIFPGEFLHHPSPQTLGTPNDRAFYNNKDYPTDKATLFYLQNSYVLGHKGLILNNKHQVFQEFSHHFGIATLKKFLWSNPFYIFSKDVKKVTGTGAALLSPESHNYYHWLSDVLPRIRLYQSVLDKIDHFCVSSKVPVKFLDLLADFDIPAEKILLINDGEKIHFDHLYVASLPGSEGRSPIWAVNYARDKLIKKPVLAFGKRIYFKRGGNIERKLLNEDVVITLLKNKGFEIIEPDNLSVADQVNLVQQAAIIISVHGAALTNLLFGRKGAAVIELFSPDYFRTDCYYTLSCMLKLNYWYLAGTKPADGNWGDITIDKDLLLKIIHIIENEQSA